VPSSPEALFERLVQSLADDPGVDLPEPGGKFGASALKVGGKIFAMLSAGQLVVKLPRQRVQELVTSGIGAPFDAGRGRVMKEWVAIAPDRSRDWGRLADEARLFVAGGY
jgi:hypothetical protein